MSSRILVAVFVLCLGLAARGEEPRFRSDVDYQLIRPAQPTSSPTGRIEVAEIFQYGCGGCFRFEPYLQSWAETKPDDVDLVLIPAVWNSLGELHARAFYTAEVLGILEQTHAPFFRAFHVEGNRLETEAKLREFFAGFGVEAARFDATFSSFAVYTKVQRAKELVTRYGVPETPVIVVNGKYLTRGELAQTYRRWFEIVDELAASEEAAE